MNVVGMSGPPCRTQRLRYRIFYTTADGFEGRCEIHPHKPIDGADDLDVIERALMARFGYTNAVIIGWQMLGEAEAENAAARP